MATPNLRKNLTFNVVTRILADNKVDLTDERIQKELEDVSKIDPKLSAYYQSLQTRRLDSLVRDIRQSVIRDPRFRDLVYRDPDYVRELIAACMLISIGVKNYDLLMKALRI